MRVSAIGPVSTYSIVVRDPVTGDLGVAMVNAGQIERALPIFADIFLRGDNWRE